MEKTLDSCSLIEKNFTCVFFAWYIYFLTSSTLNWSNNINNIEEKKNI